MIESVARGSASRRFAPGAKPSPPRARIIADKQRNKAMKRHMPSTMFPQFRIAAVLAFAFLVGGGASAPAVTIAGEPDCYLDYIESTGTQYINTGVNAETGLKARIDMEWGATVKPLSDGGDDWSMLDARKTSGDTRFYLCHLAKNTAATSFIFGYGYNSWHRTATEAVRETRFEVLADFSEPGALSIRRNGAEMLDNGQRTGHANETINLGLDLYLFACNYNGTANYFARGKLYECKIFKKNAATGAFDVERHYLPAKKDGHIGLYDAANNLFYYSDDPSGTELVAGNELPRPAAMVAWVEADGSTSQKVAQQYVDTGVWGKIGLRSRVDVTLLENSDDHAILAARGSGSSTNYRLYMAYHYNGYFCYGDGKLREPKTDDAKPVSETRYLIESDLAADSQSVKVNGVELNNGTFTGTSYFATDSTLTLFANNHKSAYVKNPSHSRLYSARIWDGDEMLRDFSPCIATNSAGATFAGLYDAVSRRVFEPTGKAFDLASQVGPVTNVLVTVDPPKTRLEYVDSDGAADYVNLGVIAKDGLEMDAVMEWLTVPDDDVFVGARPTSGNTRFFLYNAWPAHSIGYAKDLPRIADGGKDAKGNDTFFTPAANVKYRISSRLDDGDQFLAIATDANGAWAALGRTDRTYAGPLDTGIPLYLFARNYIGKADSFAHARVYSLKLRAKQPGGAYAPVLDLVPVRDPLTGGAALWDKVSESYFRSAGNFRLAGGGAEREMVLPFMMVVR